MKDEEMAEESLISYRKDPKWAGKIFMQDENTCYKDGFLTGLKAGRPQWHDAKELPPKDENAPNTSIYVLDQYGQKVFYSFFYNVWKYESDFEVRVTHWCEIPTFDKE